MKKGKAGRNKVWLLAAVLFCCVFLAGCGSRKYQAVDLEEAGSASEDDKSGRTADTVSKETLAVAVNDEAEAQSAEETIAETDTSPAEPETTEETTALAEPDSEPDAAAAAAQPVFSGHIVAIDAGHQVKANAEKEPIGPESTTMKAKMPAGSTGVVTGAKEYELNLTVAKKLEAELENRGYQVVMIRETHDVNLSHVERSKIANKSGAEILIRLHANSMENSSVYGALTMCMTEQNPYNASLHAKSYTLSKKIVDSICGQTGTKNRGVQEVDNTGLINWCEIPVSVVEMGFMSNPDEDRWLQDDSYQDKIAAGISNAVDSYFAEGN